MARKNDDDTGLPNDEQAPLVNDPYAVMQALADAIGGLGKRQDDNDLKQQELMSTLAAALARVADANIKGSEQIAQEMRRTNRPSNETVPLRSVYNQRGVLLDDYQKPPLKCIMFIPWIAEWESQTREEVELLNLLEPGSYTVTFNDDEQFVMTVKVEYALDGVTMSRLLMNSDKAFTQENKNRTLPMRVMLREIIAQIPGKDAALAAVLTEKEEAAMIAVGKLIVSM